MHLKAFTKLCLGFLRHPIYTTLALGAGHSAHVHDLLFRIRSGANWLVRAQENARDGKGYSRRYSLITGWDRSYIETTGYIIPTLLDVSEYLGRSRYRDSAVEAADWLLEIQTASGAFTDIDTHTPHVFDTGQVLLGLNRMFRETSDERFLLAIKRAARWLTDIQEADGSWVRFAYNNRPHTYYTRVAAALIETGKITGIDEYIDAGLRNLDWAIGQRGENGYYRYSEFRPGENAILHTIVYVLEGFSLAYALTGERRWAQALIDGTNVLAGLSTDGALLHSQYNQNWQATNNQYCVTGLAQYAGVCFDVAQINEDLEFRNRGDWVLTNLCQWQQVKGHDIEGALQSSVPLWGYYGGMEFFNWNIKFFLDAALKSLSFSSEAGDRLA